MILDEFMRAAVEAKKPFLTRSPDESSYPIFFADVGNGTMEVLPLAIPNELWSAALFVIWRRFRELKVERYVVISEGWMVIQNERNIGFAPNNEREFTKWYRENKPAPSKDPNRVETLIVVGIERAGLRKQDVYRIERDERGNPSLVLHASGSNEEADVVIAGRLTRLLEDRPPEDDVMPPARGTA